MEAKEDAVKKVLLICLFSRTVRQTLVGAAGWASTAVILSDALSTTAKIATTRGAIGWVPDVPLAVNAPRGVKPIILRALFLFSAAVVSAIYGGRQLSPLRNEQVAGLMSGAISNWKSLDGST